MEGNGVVTEPTLIIITIKIHVIFACAALFSLIGPMVTKKGGKSHRFWGRVYVRSMNGAALTAIIASCWRIFGHANTSESMIASSVFMIFLACFAIAGIRHGLSALAHKNRVHASKEIKVLAPQLLILLLAILSIAGGIKVKQPILIFFPIVGVFVSYQNLRYWLRPPELKMHWFYEHMSGMFTACIGTITAFVVVALPRLVNDAPWSRSLWAWLTPSLILVPLLSFLTRKYQKKFES